MDIATKRKIIEIGFMAATRGWEKEAKSIFSGVSKLSPESEAPYLGLALASMTTGKVDNAIEILLRGQAELPDNDEIKVFLGLAYHLSQKDDAKNNLLTELAADPSSPVGRMAQTILKSKEA